MGNDNVVLNQLGALTKVRVRVTPKDWDDSMREARVLRAQVADFADIDSANLHGIKPPLVRALERVLGGRYVAEIGRKPTPEGQLPGEPRFQLTLRRYVGRKLDATPVFTCDLPRVPGVMYDAQYMAYRWDAVAGDFSGTDHLHDLPKAARFALHLPRRARAKDPRAATRSATAKAAASRADTCCEHDGII